MYIERRGNATLTRYDDTCEMRTSQTTLQRRPNLPAARTRLSEDWWCVFFSLCLCLSFRLSNDPPRHLILCYPFFFFCFLHSTRAERGRIILIYYYAHDEKPCVAANYIRRRRWQQSRLFPSPPPPCNTIHSNIVYFPEYKALCTARASFGRLP